MNAPRPLRILTRQPWRQHSADAEASDATTPSEPEEFAHLREAMTHHLHLVADFVELDQHDRALISFRAAMAISSELEIRSARATGPTAG